MKKIITLGIETSCDETSIAVVEDGRKVLSNIILSQIKDHRVFGGVVPEVASRKHIENIGKILNIALEESNKQIQDIDYIGITNGPGLAGALLVGLSYGKALAYKNNIPFYGINHIEGHIYSNFIDTDIKPPFISLIVSGGHTHLVFVKDYGRYELIGKTRDDAAGEAFDKVARALGLDYPGGPEIDKLAKLGNYNNIDFPKALNQKDNFDFSFSGLKSSVLNYLNSKKMKNENIVIEDVAASFQRSVNEILVEKTINSALKYNQNMIVIAGGVGANSGLRKLFEERLRETNININFPPLKLCTDNAAMIASVTYYKSLREKSDKLDLNAIPNLKIQYE